MTRYAYVLTSSKNSSYAALCLVSALSVRRADPQAVISVLCDSLTLTKLRQDQHQILEVADEFLESSATGSPGHVSRIIKTTMLQRMQSDFIFLDADTVVLQPLGDRFSEPHSIQMALDRTPGVSHPCFPVWFAPQFDQLGWPWPTPNYYNSGVMVVRADKASEALFEEWHRRWKQFLSCGLHYDQPALNSAIHALDIPVGILPVPYNAMVRVDESLRQEAKVLHFFSDGYHESPGGSDKGTAYTRLIAAAVAGQKLSGEQVHEAVQPGEPLVAAGEVRRRVRGARFRIAWRAFCHRLKGSRFSGKDL